MLPPVRGVGGFPLTAMALALGIWGVSGASAMAQGGGTGAPGVGAGSTGGWGATAGNAYSGPAYGAPGVSSGLHVARYANAGYAGPVSIGYGPGLGIFGPGYPGYGLEYDCGCGHHSLRRHLREASLHNWGGYVLGKQCLYPYVADPYSDPKAALGFWPPYSAPTANTPTW
jgi:hypothetical protein